MKILEGALDQVLVLALDQNQDRIQVQILEKNTKRRNAKNAVMMKKLTKLMRRTLP